MVFLSSCISLLLNFVTTPLIAGMFDTGEILISIQTTGARAILNRDSGHLPPSSSQFTDVAYNYLWLGGQLPAFTTPEYTVLPVSIPDGTTTRNETWAAETTLFESELSCDNARVEITWHADVRGASINITSTASRDRTVQLCDLGFVVRGARNNQGCDGYSPFMTPWTSITHLLSTQNGSQQIYMNAWVSGPNPPWEDSSHPHPPTNVTALFCTIEYYSQVVTANFSMPAGTINSVNRTGIRKAFKLLDLAGVVIGERDLFWHEMDSGRIIPFGTRPTEVPGVDAELRRRFGHRPEYLNPYFSALEGSDNSTMESESIVDMDSPQSLSGYALSSRTEQSLGEFLDPLTLAASYDRTLKLWFALAIAVDMVDNGPGVTSMTSVDVMRHLSTGGFVVDEVWAWGAQVMLAIVTVMSAVLAVWIRRRPCNLDGEPNSLAEVIQLLASSPEMCAKMQKAEYHSAGQIRTMLEDGGGRYELELVKDHGPRLNAIPVQQVTIFLPPGDGQEVLTPWMEKLWPMSVLFGIGCLFIFGTVLALMAAAFVYSNEHEGE